MCASNVIPFPSRPGSGFPSGWPAGENGRKLEELCQEILSDILQAGRHDTIEAVRVRGLKMIQDLQNVAMRSAQLRRSKGASA